MPRRIWRNRFPRACHRPVQLQVSDMTDAIQGDQLKSIIERIERLEEEKKTISDDIKEVYGEAKANGYDAKIIRKVIAIRKRDYNERMEEETLLDLYLNAVGQKA
jgi:uncharacterized protein (UPF0335 family)